MTAMIMILRLDHGKFKCVACLEDTTSTSFAPLSRSVDQQILVIPVSSRPNGLCYSLLNALEYRMPGAILGVWVVTWLRPGRGRPDWRERVARSLGGIWMMNVGLLIGYGLIFR
jgi:hypothetical protein